MFRIIEILFGLFFLISMAKTVLKALMQLTGQGGVSHSAAREPTAPPQSTSNTHTMLQQDPVCGTYVSVDTSLKRLVGGRVLHFCSPECRDRYPA